MFEFSHVNYGENLRQQQAIKLTSRTDGWGAYFIIWSLQPLKAGREASQYRSLFLPTLQLPGGEDKVKVLDQEDHVCVTLVRFDEVMRYLQDPLPTPINSD